jgi:bifunctional non-homologous end joining protein LigD
MLYAFDLLDLNGKDLRPLPLGERKAKLARLLAGLSAVARQSG